MRIGMIAPPFIPVPPLGYGGTELVIDVLARGLEQAGHEVRLFTVRESGCPVPSGWWYKKAMGPIGLGAIEATHVTAAYRNLAYVDVIHDHTLIGPLAFAGRVAAPVVATCHSPFTDDMREVYADIARRAALVTISRSQRESAMSVPVAAVVHHGLDLTAYTPGDGSGGYLAFVARMSPDKGPHRAIRIARSAGRRLLLAAKMREPEELEFFRACVQPLLGPDIEFIGELNATERLELFQGAAALLNPIEWLEPFGLSMIEALACGTPVLSEAYGSAREIITDGRTGFLSDDAAGLVGCVDRLDQIDRAECRAEVERRFSMARMVTDYLDVYADVLRGGGPRLTGRAGHQARTT